MLISCLCLRALCLKIEILSCCSLGLSQPHFSKFKSRPIRCLHCCLSKFKSRLIQCLHRRLSKFKSRAIRCKHRCLSKFMSRPIRCTHHCLSKFKRRSIWCKNRCLLKFIRGGPATWLTDSQSCVNFFVIFLSRVVEALPCWPYISISPTR